MSYVTDYIDLYKTGKVKFNKERIELVDYLENNVLHNPDLYFDEQHIETFVKFAEKWYFPLQPFQKFLVSFVFLYRKDGRAFYRDFLWMMGRGGGKNGLISALGNYLISEFHGVPFYDGSIVANSEEQAKTSITEIYNVVHSHPDPLEKAFYATNTLIKSKATGSVLKYRTSNGNTKDGLRDGFVIFDEIHEYADSKNVDVHISGLGKKQPPRVFYIGTDGYVRDGFIDKKKALAEKILTGKAAADRMFPFICKIDNKEEADEPEMWEKANPMLSKPLSKYAAGLLDEVHRDYDDLAEEPSKREEFMTKRMDFPSTSQESSVAPWEEIKATNQPVPSEIEGREAIGAVDFATTRDFVAAAVTVKWKDKLVTLEHQWATKPFVDWQYQYSRKPSDREAHPNQRITVPIAEWEKQGLLTIVDKPILDPKDALLWMVAMRERFQIKEIVMDNYRASIMRKLFEDEGFEVTIIKNPTSIDGLLATIIDNGFPKHRFIWGDNPLLRWNTNNVLVKYDGRGNKQYLKKEEVRRKTDGFKAFEYTLYAIDKINDQDISENLDMLSSLNF
ncbi:terminase TerL endonuclease subunit [Lacticaseibacillus rhamnosus]|uniref:terminase TerL endonuclease subunit n=1 Tax=Lacticaseibacillus rhamnosus TaxID=47715 RepID=UPI00237FD413|nr:terminase TerL endonuclease subunit [Lacticaseibacillus rhamnosus]MDE3295901.1 terminase large subunit [Lacticaseibacillus rhamnosus]